MKHPTSLLAGYVDDSLEPSEHKRVEAHLRSCQSCTDEVATAVAGRDALRSLGQEDVPIGVTAPVIQEAAARAADPDRPAAPRGQVSPLRSRYAGMYKVMAAAAAILIVGALATSLFRSDPTQMSAGSAESAPTDFMDLQDADPGRYDLDGNYTAAELTAYAQREVQAFGDAAPKELAEAPSAVAAPGAPDQVDSSLPASGASRGGSIPAQTQPISSQAKFGKCLDTIGAFDHGGELISSFEGRYLDTPAYFATLTEGPDAGQPHDRLVVWVLGKNCWVLAFTQQRFPSATPSPLPTDYMHP